MQDKKKIIENHWYRKNLTWLTFLLLPFSGLFRLLVWMRYFLYRFNIIKKNYFSIPVIVVGNLTVGGTGKTPLVIWLADLLQKHGYRPGIVSRGVGGKKRMKPQWVDTNTEVECVGDEAILLAKRTACPMVVCVDRVAAVAELLKKSNCNVVISDDGLQHYRMGRDIEIIVVDGVRELGNSRLLPAGPLRESPERLQQADMIIIHGKQPLQNSILNSKKNINKSENMILSGHILHSIAEPNKTLALSKFSKKRVHAIAGIGHPQRFFSSLREQDIQVIEHVFPDHYLYRRNDIYFADDLPVIMTEKDAVKCGKWADQRHWYLPVQAEMSLGVSPKIFSLLETLCKHSKK